MLTSTWKLHLAALAAFLFVPTGAHPSYATCDPTTDPDKTDIASARAAVAGNCNCTGELRHGAYVSCAAQQANAVLKNKSCAGFVKKCASHSTCGKPNAVTCCLTSTKGTSCKVKPDAAHCTAKQGTVGSCTSCCDACPAPGGGPSCPAPSTTTSTTTATSTTTTTSTMTTTTTPGSCGGTAPFCGGSCSTGYLCTFAGFLHTYACSGTLSCGCQQCASGQCGVNAVGATCAVAQCPPGYSCAGPDPCISGEVVCFGAACATDCSCPGPGSCSFVSFF